MHKFMRAAFAAAALVAASGCASDLITGGPLVRPGEPTGIIRVVNATSHTVDVVLISACSASTYGLNRLPSGAGIGRGQSYDFVVSAGCWDVDAGSTGGMAEARQRMHVDAGGGVQYTVHD